MEVDILVPQVGESITSGLLAAWLKKDGDRVQSGEEIFELETDKTTLSVPSPESGSLKILVQADEEVKVGQRVGIIDTDASKKTGEPLEKNQDESGATTEEPARKEAEPDKEERRDQEQKLSPAVRRIVFEEELDISRIRGTGKDGRITKGDALKALKDKKTTEDYVPDSLPSKEERVSRIKMSRLRQRIAENLVWSKQTSAHLTTFNEVDMSQVMEMRNVYKEEFEKKHGVRLGFMSFFIRAAQLALQSFPELNASIEEDEIVYHHYYDIGIALSTDKGLITPVIRDADRKSFAEIEKKIISFRDKAREKKLTPGELAGATFTITNGGVFGSLLSTPIPSSPQTGILGMHTIQKRPVVMEDQIVIRPMMYLALTYDHRIIDGKEAVGFLIRIKNLIEEPRRMLIDL